MRKARVLLTVLLIALIAVLTPLIRPAYAQSNPKILRVAFAVEPPVLLSYFSSLGVTGTITLLYMQPQWGRQPDGTLVPTLIDELPSEKNGGVSHTADGKTVIKFKLADWAVWSDGQPIVADDFKLVNDVANDGVSSLFTFSLANGAKIDSIEQGATNKDVTITFGQALIEWAKASIVPLPSHVLRAPYEAALKNHKGMDTLDFLRAPTVSNGPYVFAEWKAGQYVRFVRNSKYWKTPYFDEVDTNFYPDNKVIEELLVSGGTDMTSSIPFLQALDIVNKNANTLQLQKVFYGVRWELKMNQGPTGFAALKDASVRKAIEMGIDRQSIVDNLYEGKSKVPRSFWDDTPWYNKDIPQVGYDPDGAKALLKQAGWYDADGDGVIESHGVKDVPDNTPFVVKASSYSDATYAEGQNLLLAAQDNLSKIGIKIDKINLYTAAIMHDTLTHGGKFATGAEDLSVQLWGVGSTTDIDQPQYYSCAQIPTDQNPTGWNGFHICNPEMDKQWDVAQKSLNADERLAAVNKVQAIMADQVPTIYLVNWYDAILINKSVQGFTWGQFPTIWITLTDATRTQ